MSSSVMTPEQQQATTAADLSALAGLLLITQQRGVRLHLGIRTPNGFPASCKTTTLVALVTTPKRCLYAARVPLYRRGKLISNLTDFTDITPVMSPATIERDVPVDEAVRHGTGWLVTVLGQAYLINELHAVVGLRVVETVRAQQLSLNVDITQDQLEDVAAMLWEAVERDIDRTVDYDPASTLVGVPAVPSVVQLADADGLPLPPRRFKPFFGGEMPDSGEILYANVRIRLEPPSHEE